MRLFIMPHFKIEVAIVSGPKKYSAFLAFMSRISSSPCLMPLDYSTSKRTGQAILELCTFSNDFVGLD